LKIGHFTSFSKILDCALEDFGQSEMQCIFLHKLFRHKMESVYIEKVKKLAGGVALYISSIETPLLLPASKVEREDLKEGAVLTPAHLENLKVESELFQCDKKAAALLSQRDYSIGQFRQKLKFKNFGENTIREIVHKYKSRGLLDDKKYAAKVVSRILQEKPSGRPFLIASLRSKLIPRELADETVDSLFQNEDAVSLAVDALSKRWRQFGQFEVEQARTKSYNYLSRRGFGYRAARAAFEKLWQKKLEDDDKDVRIY